MLLQTVNSIDKVFVPSFSAVTEHLARWALVDLAELRLGPSMEVGVNPLRARVRADVDSACCVNMRQVSRTRRRKRVLKPTPQMCKAAFLNNGQEESVRVLVTSTLERRFGCALGTELSRDIIPIFIICIAIVLLGVCCYYLFHVLGFTSAGLNIVFDPIEDGFASPLMFLAIQSSSYVDRIFLAELLACEFFFYYFDSLEILLVCRW